MPHLALTATATKDNIRDIISSLELVNPTVVEGNPDRPNIFIDVRQKLSFLKKEENYENILGDVHRDFEESKEQFPVTIMYGDSADLVYAYRFFEQKLGKRQYVEGMEEIPENRVFAQFHAKITKGMKTHIISELCKVNPKLRLVFATVALGMGLNAPSIQRIIHFRPPTNLEKYMQEIGRAGRSGQKAHAICYYNNSDLSAGARPNLDPAVPDFFRDKQSCLREQLLRYFGFSTVLFSGPTKECCSNCKNKE